MDTKLKERREAFNRATSEFNRVKRAKLSASSGGSSEHSGDGTGNAIKDRERANRASAAASRAKVVYYSRELEVRTDRLETERNHYMFKYRDTSRSLEKLTKKNKQLKKVLRELWELKDAKICAYLVDCGILFLLSKSSPNAEDLEEDNGNGNHNHYEEKEEREQEENVGEKRPRQEREDVDTGTLQGHDRHQPHLPQNPSVVQQQQQRIPIQLSYRNPPPPQIASAPATEQSSFIRRSNCTEDSHSPSSYPANLRNNNDNSNVYHGIGERPTPFRRSSCSEESTCPTIPKPGIAKPGSTGQPALLPPLSVSRSTPFQLMYQPPPQKHHFMYPSHPYYQHQYQHQVQYQLQSSPVSLQTSDLPPPSSQPPAR